MRSRYRRNRSTGEARKKILLVFKELRRLEYIARMNYMCCSSCAGYALGERWEKNPTKKGIVFFHRQDDEHYREYGNLAIRYWGGLPNDTSEEADRKTVEVGNAITAILAKEGIVYRWDGTPEETIAVYDSTELLQEEIAREQKRAEEVARHVKTG